MYSNITFKKNKKYLITGKSGAGKSTLAKILSGELKDFKGEIIVDSNKEPELSSITYVPQSSHLFYDNIHDNIAMYRDINKDDMNKSISLANLYYKILEKEIDFNSEVSGGEKSRVVLARSLAFMPKVMIIDEPTANLNYKNSMEIIQKNMRY